MGLLFGGAVGAAAQLALATRRARQLALLRSWIESVAAGERPPRLEGLAPDYEAAFAGSLFRLYRSLRREQRRREEAQRALETLIATFPEPLVVIDPKLRIAALSEEATQIFGMRLGDHLFASLRDPGLLSALETALARGETSHLQITLPGRPPRCLAVHIVPAPLPTHGRGAVVFLRELTEQLAIERMRSDFVANVSHELRTPLAALAGIIDTLRGPAREDPQAREEFLALAAEETARMTRLVQDLLSLAQIEQSALQPPRERCALPEIVARVVRRFEPLAARAGVVLALQLAPELPAVLGDADQLEQLVGNLVDNAIRYGASGGRVVIEVVAEAAAPAGTGPVSGRPAVRLSVTDFGPGIAPEHLPRLTERFYRVDKARSRALGGTGLGLAIVKHILRRHQGHLAIHSEVGKGSCFTVRLPIAGPGRDCHTDVTHLS